MQDLWFCFWAWQQIIFTEKCNLRVFQRYITLLCTSINTGMSYTVRKLVASTFPCSEVRKWVLHTCLLVCLLPCDVVCTFCVMFSYSSERYAWHEWGISLRGWKLQTVCLSGTGKNKGGQVKILDTFPKERLKFWKSFSICLFRQAKIVLDREILQALFRRIGWIM